MLREQSAQQDLSHSNCAAAALIKGILQDHGKYQVFKCTVGIAAIHRTLTVQNDSIEFYRDSLPFFEDNLTVFKGTGSRSCSIEHFYMLMNNSG